ncbi:inositol monophosphatase family protein [Kamptonema cortianum]|nr:inositol monophosphatase family protein [Oscillatoria laete-virens]MDK3159925.1 inositol monophosphatase family protein [Kamptonema cortianum]MDL5050506.1 inositol monophosphatase family protein [Oscillatoria amoena NRMC-F 0135]MDL5055518.1 inositol monophosphatase family protein [Oscillatoria laete-virens NRMC-F 0139]
MFLPTAIAAAQEAGKLLRAHFGGELIVNENHAHDVKLELDVRSQTLIEGILLKAHPEHAIFGEEGIRGNQRSQYRWIVDPIDGTVNFSFGIPHFAISIGLECDGKIVLGVIYDPILDELFTAEKGRGATLNGKPIHVSGRDQLKDAILVVGMSKYNDSIKTGLELIGYYSLNAKKLRNMGSAALAMAWIACGRLDGYIERNIGLWDVAAGKILIEEAGGHVDITDNAPQKNLKIICGNGKLPLSFSIPQS